MISAWLGFTLADKLKGKEEENHSGQPQMDGVLVLLMGTTKLGEALFRPNTAAEAWADAQDSISLPGTFCRDRKGLFPGDGTDVG